MGKGCAGHVVCFLSFLLWVIGAGLLGITIWMLGTSPSMKRFFSGTLYFSYVLLSLGGLLFITGLVGWIGSYKRGGCLIKMFLLLSVLDVASEIGGIVALNILRMKMSDILESGWNEINQPARNLIQEHFSCCGFRGPEEFAQLNDPIDDSCYTRHTQENQEQPEGTEDPAGTTTVLEVRRLNRNGCKEKLVDWFYNHKILWIVALGVLLLLQVTAALTSIYLHNQMKRSDRSSSTQSLPIIQSYL